MASFHGQRTSTNCTIDGSRPRCPDDPTRARYCASPFAFASGTFFLVSRGVVRELLSHESQRKSGQHAASSWLDRDIRRAQSYITSTATGVGTGVGTGGRSRGSLCATRSSAVFILGCGSHSWPHLASCSCRAARRGWLPQRARWPFWRTKRHSGVTRRRIATGSPSPLACWPNASLATRAAIQSQGEERLFAPRVLPPICSSDDTGFEKWTVRPPKARTCVLRVRPIDPAWRQGFACESSN